jgi:hypothetical protein
MHMKEDEQGKQRSGKLAAHQVVLCSFSHAVLLCRGELALVYDTIASLLGRIEPFRDPMR